MASTRVDNPRTSVFTSWMALYVTWAVTCGAAAAAAFGVPVAFAGAAAGVAVVGVAAAGVVAAVVVGGVAAASGL